MSQTIMVFDRCDIGFETPHIFNLTLDVKKRDFISIVGPTGVGKTTLLRLTSGVDKKGRQPRCLKGEWKRPDAMTTGIVFQSLDQLLPWKTALENVLLPLLGQDVKRLNGTKEDFHKRAEFLMKMVGLQEHMDKYPADLSGGMRQRVAIARAMLLEPQLLLMDEPFGSLDAITRKALQSLLKSIYNNTETTILFVTHDVEEAMDLSNRILVLNKAGHGLVIDQVKKAWPQKIKDKIMNQLGS